MAKTGSLPSAFEYSRGEANGGTYTSDFSATTDSWTGVTRVSTAQVAGPIGGESNLLSITCDTSSGTHYVNRTATTTAGYYYRVSARVYVPSGQSNVDGFRIGDTLDNTIYIDQSAPTLDTWVYYEGTAVALSATVQIRLLDGGVQSFQDAAGDNLIYVRDLTVTRLGPVADYRSENFDTADGILFDASGNGLDATNNGATYLGGRKAATFQQLTLNNLPTSSAGLGTGRVWNNSGVLTVV